MPEPLPGRLRDEHAQRRSLRLAGRAGYPRELAEAGVLTIPQAGVDASFSTSGVGGSGSGPIPNVGVGCVGSNDSLMGEIAITSIDATQVTLDFMGVQTLLEEPVAPPVITAQYETTRCP